MWPIYVLVIPMTLDFSQVFWFKSQCCIRVQLGSEYNIIFNIVKWFVPSVLNLYLPTDLQLKVKWIASFPSHKLIFLWNMGQIYSECI